MLPKSIRQQLPLTYAGIALLAALALGAVLLVTLRGYYSQQEIEYLKGNAQAISQILGQIYSRDITRAEIQFQLGNLSFLTQARVRVLNMQQEVIADSGSFQNKQFIQFNYDNRVGIREQEGNVLPPAIRDWFSFAGGDNIKPLTDSQVGLSLSTRQIPVPPPQGLTDASKGDFVIAVAGTPYGFGLNSDINSFVRSDQQVKTPVMTPDQQIIGYVQLSEGPSYGTDIVQGVARALLGAGFAAVIVAGGVGWIISRRISAPLQTLTATTMQMAEGNLSARVDLARRDEFGVLARTFNEMAGRVENTITTLQRFVADAAHELHTPLTAVHANLELAASESDNGCRAHFLAQAQGQLTRLETLTTNLLDLSRIESRTLPDARVTLDLVQLVRETSELYASRAEQKGISFEFEVPRNPIPACICENQFRRVLANLLDNAIKFTPENGTVWLGICCDEDYIHLWVKDTGIGIPPEDLPHLFSRFRRGGNAASYPGSGLGLAITQAIVEGHRGKVSVTSGDEGTHFRVEIPALESRVVIS
jgi:signal transduction histidine kinase